MSPEQEQAILKLRQQNFTPRQIAAHLGLRVSAVRAVVAAHGDGPVFTLASKGELPPVHECLVSGDCGNYLFGDAPKTMPDSCLGLVLIARLKGYDRVSVCTYLVDYLCLGVKDTMGPRQMERDQYPDFVKAFYQAFPEGPQLVELKQAQAIVFGAVEYAARLGFQPHEDFEKTLYHLGPWGGDPQLEFGHEGKPLYINGPYDDSRGIIKQLESRVGRGGFNYILGIG